MVDENYRRLTTCTVYFDDLKRLHTLKQKREYRQKWSQATENNADVISNALDALEKERSVSRRAL